MSECVNGEAHCTCTTTADKKTELCKCEQGYMGRDNQCYNKKCYDPLTDSFCGNLGFNTCNNDTGECNCGNTGLTLVSFKGRCVTKNCLIGEDSDQKECWEKGYCQVGLAGGACRCYSAYMNNTGCTECNPETSLEKTEADEIKCIPKACMDKKEPNVANICNNMGDCTPFVNSESTMLYICKCRNEAFGVGDSCYPKECVITDPLVSNSLTVCNSKGTCDFDTKKCKCNAPHAGIFCRSCQQDYISKYITTENGFLFLCIHHNCWDPSSNTHCSGHGDCRLDAGSSEYQCVCEAGYRLKEGTHNICTSDTVHNRNRQGYILLSDTLIIVLLAIAILAIGIYLLVKVLFEKKAKRDYKVYIHQEKITIARNLHNDQSSVKKASVQSSILSTADHVAFQRRYV